MIELGTCILCSFIGAGVAILCQRSSLNKYFTLVECLWNRDLTAIDRNIEHLQRRIHELEKNS